MTANDCLKLLRDIKDVVFATVDLKGMPQARMIDVMLVENECLYFCTARGKDFYNEIINNGNVAVTGMNQKFQMVRLTGQADKLSDQNFWIDRIFLENPVMNKVYPNESRYILEPFIIDSGELEFFDLGNSPIYRECFSLNNIILKRKGYHIMQSCIGCGKCKIICPSQCIRIGTPYEIISKNCLHCGLCYENCPVKAIKRREK